MSTPLKGDTAPKLDTYAAYDDNHTATTEAPRESPSSSAKPSRDFAGKRNAAAQGDDKLITVEPLRRSDMAPTYAQTMDIPANEHTFYGSMINCLGEGCGLLGSIPGCFCFPNPFKRVHQGSVGLVSRFGQFYKSVDPGLTRINPFSESLRIVDVKIQLTQIPKQEVITRDNVSLTVDSVLYWHVVNPYRATYGIADVRSSLIERAQCTVRDVVGSKSFQHVIQEREAIAAEIETILAEVTHRWGTMVESLQIKDLGFSVEMQQAFSSAAQSKRLAESRVIAARGEVDAAKLMREAADILSSSAAIQIRQLEALQTMAKSAGSKVIFVPMDLIRNEGVAHLTQAEMIRAVADESKIKPMAS